MGQQFHWSFQSLNDSRSDLPLGGNRTRVEELDSLSNLSHDTDTLLFSLIYLTKKPKTHRCLLQQPGFHPLKTHSPFKWRAAPDGLGPLPPVISSPLKTA
jgi:hypothetical protein